jgi:hypothetical protein
MRTNRPALGRALCNTLIATVIIAVAIAPAVAEIQVRADRITQANGTYWLHLTGWNCSAGPLAVDGGAPWGQHTLKARLALLERSSDAIHRVETQRGTTHPSTRPL